MKVLGMIIVFASLGLGVASASHFGWNVLPCCLAEMVCNLATFVLMLIGSLFSLCR